MGPPAKKPAYSKPPKVTKNRTRAHHESKKSVDENYRPRIIVKFRENVQLPKAYGVVPFVKTLKQPSSSPQFRNLDLRRLITSVKSKRIAELEKKEETRIQNRAIQEQRLVANQASQSPILSQSELNDRLKGMMKIQKKSFSTSEKEELKNHILEKETKLLGVRKKEEARSKFSFTPPRMNAYDVIYPPRGVEDIGSLVTQIRSLKDIIEIAYIDPPYDDPQGARSSTVNYDNNPHFSHQKYLHPAPIGVGAIGVWQIPGGNGVGQALVDLEQGWTLNHEDLVDHGATMLHGSNKKESKHHGTGILGICCASDNHKGCVGVAPYIDSLKVVSYYSSEIVDAIEAAIDNMESGDVLLIEAETMGSYEYPYGYPIEIVPGNFEVIKEAVALGIIVVECGGNGGYWLDNYFDPNGKRILNRGDRDFKDSGAIMVGAADSTQPYPYARWYDSNYGNRIDCFAWGENICTLSSDRDGSKRKYFEYFDGTSGAGAIIAGVALSLQGMAEANLGRRLEPEEMRGLISDQTINTPSKKPNDRIGVMPNLKAIADNFLLRR
jgi:hypothetical protein